MELTKEEYDFVKREYEADRAKKDKPKVFKFKFGQKSKMNSSLKRNDEVLVFLLNLKKTLEFPIVTKIYGGNFLVIRNRVYRYNPSKVFAFMKYKAVIAREYDRELIGVDDYEDLMIRDFSSDNPGNRVNVNDPVLIKALIQAKLSEKPTTAIGSKWIIIALVILGVIVGFFLLTSKKAPTPTPATDGGLQPAVPANVTG